MSFIALANVSKRYGSVQALRSVSLSVEQGSTVLLTGPNGAGKSTLLRILCGLERPDYGSVTVDGLDLTRAEHYRQWKEKFRPGVLQAHTFLYGELSVKENLLLAARLQRLEKPAEAIEQIVEALELQPVLSRRARDCSQGMQRRASLARALIHRPRLILLDEPLTNLDETGRRAVVRLLTEFSSAGATLLTATHDPELLHAGKEPITIRLERGALV